MVSKKGIALLLVIAATLVFTLIVIFSVAFSQDNKENAAYVLKTFAFVGVTTDDQAKKADEKVMKWLSDNGVKEYEWHTAAGYGVFYVTVRYKK